MQTSMFQKHAVFKEQYIRKCPEFRKKFKRKVPLFLQIPEFSYNTVWDGTKEAPRLKSARSV